MSPDDDDIPQLDLDDVLMRVGEWVDFTHAIVLKRERDSQARVAHKCLDAAYDLIVSARTQIENSLEAQQ